MATMEPVTLQEEKDVDDCNDQTSFTQELPLGNKLELKPIIISGPIVRRKQFLHYLGMVLDQFWLHSRDIQSKRSTIIELLPVFACGAVETNDLYSVQEIVNKMDVNCGDYDDFKPMHRAAECGNIEMVTYLMKKGSSWQLMNHFGENPLSLAIKNRHFDLIKFLKLHHAVLKMPLVRAAMRLQQAVAKRDFSALYAWSLAELDMDEKDYNGRTAMHLAVRMRDKQLVQILLRYGATPLERDIWNQTPLDEARKHNLDGILTLFHPRFTVQFPNKQAYLQHIPNKKLETDI
ncbi:L-asparaginase isoform X1 [Alosa alosa]|uniref:L-asparaginase isoform X1 n=1 Tax=Alosa alosa TaxID=278164 RepID=UPI0020154D73|nr:L-asparaginase isoform X1 [Alosa alosa]